MWGINGAQATGITVALRGLWNNGNSRIWGRFTRSGLSHSSCPLLNQRQRQKHLTWVGEKKNWTVEIKAPESGGKVEMHRSHVICWCRSTVLSSSKSMQPSTRKFFIALHASFHWHKLCQNQKRFYFWFWWDAEILISFSSRTHCQKYQYLV